jgi:hypothetical protein
VKIYVAMIRNGNTQRDPILLEGIEVLRNYLPEDVELVLQSFIEQPPLVALSFSERAQMLWNNNRYFLELQLRVRKNASAFDRTAQITYSLLRDLLAVFVHWLGRDLRSARIRANTRKHVMAWRSFLTSDADALLVLEDDAFLLSRDNPSDLAANVNNFLAKLRDYKSLTVLSLSRPFSLKELGYHTHVQLIGDGFVTLKIPTVNTASSYALTRTLASKILGELDEASEHTNADLLLAHTLLQLSSRLSAQEEQIACMHADPPMFDNASLTGGVPTTLQPNRSSFIRTWLTSSPLLRRQSEVTKRPVDQQKRIKSGQQER